MATDPRNLAGLLGKRATRRAMLAGGAGGAAALAFANGKLATAAPSGHPRLVSLKQDAGAIITIGTLGEARTVNPFISDESEGDWRCKMLFDEFIRPDPASYAPTPGLAASWEVDDLTFTFNIQPNATFSDGTDVTAEDVKFTFEGFLKPETASTRAPKFLAIEGAEAFNAGDADEVSGIQVLDPKTIQITLAGPDAPFLYNMRYIFVVPRALLENSDLSNASEDPFFQNPIGAGPYVFENWNVGGEFTANANPNFWEEGKPAVSRLTHLVIADSSALVNALQSGDIDGSLYAAPTLAEQLEENPELLILVPPFGAPNGTFFNTRRAPLDNPEVRRAIAMAVNVDEYVSSSLLGLGDAGLGPIAPDSWAHDPSIEPIPYDPEAARAILEETGAIDAELTALCNAGNILREDWLVRMQFDLQQIGMNLNIEFIEWATLVETVTTTREFDIIGADFAGVAAEPTELYDQFHSSSASNHSGYTNPELDTLLEQAREELDQEVAATIFSDIQNILMRDVPMHWAWYRPFIHVMKDEYENYEGSNLEGGVFRTLPEFVPTGPQS